MLSLGNINFGLGVDTSSLGASVQRVQQFGRAVEAAAASSAQGANVAAAALRRQEAASLSALQSVLRFNQEARRMHVPAGMLNQASQAFNALSTRMTQGRVSTLQYQRSMEDFQARMGRVRRELAAFEPSPNGSKFKVLLQDMTSSATLALGPLSGVGARITALSGIMGRSTFVATAFFAAIAAGGYAFYKMGKSSVDTEMALERVRSRLSGLSRTNQEATADFERIRAIADQTGNSFTVLAEQWTNIKAAAKNTSLEGEKSFEVFRNLSVAAAQFRLNGVQVEATFKAISQMMSKGTVQLEELKGQLGDQLPVAMQAAAKAMGVTTKQLNEMIRKGKVTTEEFLVPFSRAIADLLGVDPSKKVDSLQASIGRLGNAITFFNDAANQAFGYTELFKSAVEGATQLIMWASTHLEELAWWAKVAGAALLGAIVPEIAMGLLSMGQAALALAINFRSVGTAIMAVPWLRLLSILAAVTIAFFSLGESTQKISDTFNTSLSQSAEQYISLQQTMRTQSSSTTKHLISEVEKQIGAMQLQQEAMLKMRDSMLMSDEKSWGDTARSWVKSFDDAIRSNADSASSGPLTDYFNSVVPGSAEKLASTNSDMQELIASMSHYRKLLKDLKEIGEKPDVSSGAPGSPVDPQVLDRAGKSIRDARQAIQELQNTVANAGQGLDSFKFLEKQSEAAKKVADFRDRLSDAKVPLKEVTLLTGMYAKALNMANEASTKMELAPFDRQIQDLQQTLDAVSQGPQVYKDFQKQEETNQKIRDFRDALVQAGAPLDVINTKTLEFATTVQTLNTTLQGPFAAVAEMFNTFESETVTAFKSITDAFGEMAVNGKFDADSMVNIAKSMVSRIISELMTLTIVNPLLNSIFSPSTPYPSFFGGGGGGGGFLSSIGSAIGGLFGGGGGLYAKGGAFSGGVRFMAQGGLLRGATAFQTRDGVAMGGEAGTEAVMPLHRTKNGDLGVRVMGGGSSGPQVTIIDQRQNAPPIQREQDGSGNFRFLIKDQVNSILNTGQADSSLAGRFGVKPAKSRR